MTTELEVVKAKVGPAGTGQAVTQACWVMGYSRDSFYRFREIFTRNVLIWHWPRSQIYRKREPISVLDVCGSWLRRSSVATEFVDGH